MKPAAAGRGRWLTRVLAGLTALVLVLSMPASLREAFERGGLYLFSREFFTDLPRRLAGPGRFRFVLQPALAAAIGIAAGRADARAGRMPALQELLFVPERRGELTRSAVRSIANLLLMGVLLDSVSQWLILGVSYPGAALVVGPILIAVPYILARALAYRVTRALRGESSLAN
jgi:hypothetical protein